MKFSNWSFTGNKKYVCKYIKFSSWSNADIVFFPDSFAGKRVLNKEPTVRLDGALKLQKYIFKFEKLGQNNENCQMI